MKECECGCGRIVKSKNRFIYGHNNYSNPPMLGKKQSDFQKKRASETHLGIKLTKNHKEKLSKSHKGLSPWNKGLKGIHLSPDTEFKEGAKPWNWSGKIISLDKLLRHKSKMKIWRELVFLRDNFTCQNSNCEFCNNGRGGNLHSHHIKPLALYPELAFDMDNGITYCAEFHLKSGLHKNIQNKIRGYYGISG